MLIDIGLSGLWMEKKIHVPVSEWWMYQNGAFSAEKGKEEEAGDGSLPDTGMQCLRGWDMRMRKENILADSFFW